MHPEGCEAQRSLELILPLHPIPGGEGWGGGVIDTAFLRFLRGLLPGHGSVRKTERGDRHGDHESFLFMHAWYTMSPKDCAGSISLLLLFQLVSHA